MHVPNFGPTILIRLNGKWTIIERVVRMLCTDTDLEMIQPLKWHGGKYYLASKIVDLMPPHLHYVEPFFGGGAVLLARDPEDKSAGSFPIKAFQRS